MEQSVHHSREILLSTKLIQRHSMRSTFSFQILAVFACIASTQHVQFQRYLDQHDYLAVNIKTFNVAADGKPGTNSGSGRACYSAFAKDGSSFKMRYSSLVHYSASNRILQNWNSSNNMQGKNSRGTLKILDQVWLLKGKSIALEMKECSVCVVTVLVEIMFRFWNASKDT